MGGRKKGIHWMKFTDGNWFKRKGVQMVHPVEVREQEIAKDSLSVFAPIRPVYNRASGLNEPLLEIRFSSPFADVIRVQIFHYKGVQDHGPHFQTFCDPDAPVTIGETEEEASFS